MIKQGLTFLFVWQCYMVFGQAPSCDCKKDDGYYEELGAISNAKGHKIQICGNKREGTFDCGDSLHSDFIIRDCLTGDTLFEPHPPGDETYALHMTHDKIFMTRIISIGDSRGVICLSINRQEIGLSEKGFYKSPPPVPLLNTDSFPPVIMENAIEFYWRLEDTLKKTGPHGWGFNNFPSEFLLLCAVKNIGRSRELYRNLTKYFGLDGAYGESYDPSLLDYLLDNMVKK